MKSLTSANALILTHRTENMLFWHFSGLEVSSTNALVCLRKAKIKVELPCSANVIWHEMRVITVVSSRELLNARN